MEAPRLWRTNKKRLEIECQESEVYSYTTIHYPPTEYTDQTPLLMALIKTGTRLIMAQLTDVDAKDVYIGMPIEPVTRILRQDKTGIVVYGKKYRPKI